MQDPIKKEDKHAKNSQKNNGTHNSKQSKNPQEKHSNSQQGNTNEQNSELEKLKDLLARTQADFTNYKTRIERDKEDMIFFIKADIIKSILPRVDDLERIISKTPEDKRGDGLFVGVDSVYKKLIGDLEKLGVRSFDSIGQKVNPDLHEVMTQVPGKNGIILEEFEKGYMIGDKVLRVAKVIVGQS